MKIDNIMDGSKNFVGIGKIMIDTPSFFSWNIPHLHFLVDKTVDNTFEATVLEFGLVSSAETQEESIKRLVEQIVYYIFTVVCENKNYQELKDLALNNFMNDYWNAYRYIEFYLAETKEDLSHEIESKIQKAIQDTFDNKVKELIAIKAKDAADEAIKEYERISAVKATVTSYSSLKDAAA